VYSVLPVVAEPLSASDMLIADKSVFIADNHELKYKLLGAHLGAQIT
jgi:hypothetical protein